MRTGMVALALGLLAVRFLPVLPPTWLLCLMPVIALTLLPFRTYPLAFFLFGFSWACISAQSALNDRLPIHLDGQTLWLQGKVVGLPQQSVSGVVRFQLNGAQSRRSELPQRMRLSWYGGPPVRSGEYWRLAVKLKRPAGLVNPDSFDYEAWLLTQRIGATGSVADGQRIAPATSAWRDALRQRVLAVDAQGREGGLAALVLGDDSGLSTVDWQVLQDTGTVHLLVISGQHIGLLAGLIYALVAGLARWGLWPRRLPWLPWACGLAFAAALGYGLLAGFEVPVRRACTMIGMVLLWRLRFRHLGVGWPLLLSLNAVLLFEPLVSLQPGFWLSFAAVGILILVFSGRLGAWSWLQSWTRAQWLIAIGLLPVLLALNLPVSLSGPLANLFAVPWISVVVLPLALLGTLLLPIPAMGEGLLWLAGGLLEWLFQGLALVSGWWPAWTSSAVPWWAWWLSLLGGILLLLPSGMPLRLLGWPLLLMCVFPPLKAVPHGEVEVLQLDVGQGLAVLLRTRGHTLLFDAGPRFGDFDIGQRVVLPAIRKTGVRHLDVMLLSHAHADHTGGAMAVYEGLPVARVLSGEASELSAALNAQFCESGAHWEWDGVQFTTWRWEAATESNPASCVLMVDANGERLLLTGDIDAAAERVLIDSDFDLRARWLQAPHHGSRSSSSMVFLKAVKPEGVLISRGRNNAFGHPHPRVMARFDALSIQPYDSADRGAIYLQLGRYNQPQAERGRRRFWRD
ncbi:DNA internalization-related competence protein ComEC/Rec2 [Pseudomonas sp. 10B1]|uniref:DNA internalization-related competence protein ComEC/Rec2 n=1 Tax=unclassified Pseudomonas TaxID=196821 RepID=UPI002AB4D257|nr:MULTISPECIES: DNA internalization-related competence protein ComEC/Rec2 [unclassified Pseudomonas]MDY7561328.1 DNA internalization-related competence protein ComEC/Rec2 [Pseudomonas sp. AB6]MEA9979756.1 DNA internalization-related competence protein ComEC/Rec2 [Pseudomonas sp. RTS4]MEA9997349.1 DNA internalization-related competence protein ComEC/Rec2 [Pseudomonas sp. AA4]MEB0089358.1 DNA internalization-related competence protein ComEC/Rec2 [Pseudomonas sp. RTI1]MEB0128526.1 DNA internaliz